MYKEEAAGWEEPQTLRGEHVTSQALRFLFGPRWKVTNFALKLHAGICWTRSNRGRSSETYA